MVTNEKILKIAVKALKINIRTAYFLYGGKNRFNMVKTPFI